MENEQLRGDREDNNCEHECHKMCIFFSYLKEREVFSARPIGTKFIAWLPRVPIAGVRGANNHIQLARGD